MQVDGRVRRSSEQRQRQHRLAGHPKEEDVVAGLAHVGGEEALHVGGVFGPAERGERPQPGGKPRVEHVLVLRDHAAAALGALRGVFDGAPLQVAILAVPHRDAVAPPQLAADTPVADVLHPMEPRLLEAVGNDAHRSVADHADRLFGQRLGADEPLRADARFDDRVAALAMPDAVMIRLDFHQQALFLEIGHNGLAASVAFQSRVRPGRGVHHPGGRHHVHLKQIVARADLVIGGIVGGRHLHRACAEFGLYRLVGHNGNRAPNRRQDRQLANECLPARIAGVDGHAAVAEDRLRASGRHLDERGRALSPAPTAPRMLRAGPLGVHHGIADVPQVTVVLRRFHFQVGNRRLAARAPVDHVRPAIDQTALIQRVKRGAYRVAQARIERKALAFPIAGDAELPVLVGDTRVRLAFPFPALLDEGGAAQVVARQALFRQLALDDILRSDPGVIGAGQEERLEAAHPVVARHQVFDCRRHRVAQVKDAGHIRRRHGDAETLTVRRSDTFGDERLRLEIACGLPPVIQTLLVFFRIVGFG